MFIELNDGEMKTKTSLTARQFHELLNDLPTLRSKFDNNAAKDALFIYLMKIRTGATNNEIGFNFGLSRRSIGRRLNIVRNAIFSDFVPRFVNYARTREDLLQHCTPLSKRLFDPNNTGKLIWIADGTYVFIEKSEQHKFQKLSYNSHKKRNYIKVMNIVTSDGTIVFTLGPFEATKNDATIMEEILSKNPNAFEPFTKGDVLLVDRGFGNCVSFLKKKGFDVKIPASEKGDKQLSTKDANETRKITKLRFEVEHMNGMVKNMYRIFQLTCETYCIPTIMKDYTIAAALINKYMEHKRSDRDDIQIASSMLARVSMRNIVYNVIQMDKFKQILRKKQYATLLALDIFPNLTQNDLEGLAFGNYQIKQAKCYAYDHIQANNGRFDVKYFEDDVVNDLFPSLIDQSKDLAFLMTTLQSRYKSNKKYRTYILINRIGHGIGAIIGYCCACKNGLRTVGCCSHVMTMVYYLGYAQYHGGVSQKSKHLNNTFYSKNDENIEGENEDDFAGMYDASDSTD